MIACDEARVLLSDRLDGVLEVAVGARLDEHLSVCHECRTYAERLARTDAALRVLPALGFERDPWPPARERLREADRHRRARRTLTIAVLLALTAAAAFVWWLSRDDRPSPAPLVPTLPSSRPPDLTFLREPGTFVTLNRLHANVAGDAEVADLVETAELLLEEAAAEQPVAPDVVRLVRDADLRERLRASAARPGMSAVVRGDLDRVCDMLDRIAVAPERRS